MASINSVGEPLHLIQSTSSSFTSHLITFQDVPSNFPSGEEIVAFYTLENSFRCRTRDYVAIFRKDWSDPRTYITYSSAPKHAKPNTQPTARCVRFPAENLRQIQPSSDDSYQFVYVTKKKEIAGISPAFTIGAYSPSSSTSSASIVSDQSPFVCGNERADDINQSGDARAGHQKNKESVESFEMLEKTPHDASSVRDNVTQNLEPLISSLSQLGQDMFKIAVENSIPCVQCRCASENGTSATSACSSATSAADAAPVTATTTGITIRPISSQRRLYSQVATMRQELVPSRPGSAVATELHKVAIDEPLTTSGHNIISSSSQTSSPDVHRASQTTSERDAMAKLVELAAPSKTASNPQVPQSKQRKSSMTPTFGQQMAPMKLISMYDSLRHLSDGDGETADEGKRMKTKSGDSVASGCRIAAEDVRRLKSPVRTSGQTADDTAPCVFDSVSLALPTFTLAAAPQMCVRNLRESFGGGVNNSIVTVSVKSKFKCKDCRKKMVCLRSLRTRIAFAEKTISQLRVDMADIENALSLKDILLDELSGQLKNMLHENNQLVTANEKLYNDKLKIATEQNENLVNSDQRSAACIKELSDKMDLLETEKETLKSLVSQYNSATEELKEQAKIAEKRLREKQGEEMMLRQQLDDVMYTLALHGYTEIVDANGNCIDLTSKNGTLVKLKGNESSTSRQDTEGYLATIAVQEDAINSLHEECNSLRPQISIAGKKVAQLEHMLQEERDSVEKLRHQIMALMNQVALQRNHESVLSKLLIGEQNEKAELLQRHKEYQGILSERIRNLKEALQSVQLLSLHKQTSRPCERCSGAVHPDVSSSSQASLLQLGDRPVRKMSADMERNIDTWSNVDALLLGQSLPLAVSDLIASSTPTTPTTTKAKKASAAAAKPKRKASGNGSSYAAVVARQTTKLITESNSEHQHLAVTPTTNMPGSDAPSCNHLVASPSSSLPRMNDGLSGVVKSDSCGKPTQNSLDETLHQLRTAADDAQPHAPVVDDVTSTVAPPGDQPKKVERPRSAKQSSSRSRKFVLKVANSGGANASALEYTPRMYGTPPQPTPPDPNLPKECPICKVEFHTSLSMEQFLKHLKQHN